MVRVFDPFGRLTRITTRGGSPQLMARYTYNGLNWLTSRVWDNTVAPGQPDDGTVDGDDITCFYAYDASWRLIAEYRESVPSEALGLRSRNFRAVGT